MYGNKTEVQNIKSLSYSLLGMKRKKTHWKIHAYSEVNVLELTSILEDLAKAPTG